MDEEDLEIGFQVSYENPEELGNFEDPQELESFDETDDGSNLPKSNLTTFRL